MNFLIKNGLVWTGGQLESVDLFIKDGRIAAMQTGMSAEDATVIEAKDCLVAPGFTDLHVHLRQPGYEYKEDIASGTAAAAAGGFTTVCAMPNLNPVPDDLHHLDAQLGLIEQFAAVRVLPYGAVTVGQKGECLSDIAVLAPFVAGFTDDGFGVQDEPLMRRAMQAIRQAGSLIATHSEEEALLPADRVCVQEKSPLAEKLGVAGFSCESEWAQVKRDIRLCEETGCRLHICHASTAGTFSLVREAKKRGLPVTCEATPHNLLLSCEDVTEDHGRFRMNPPLRAPEDRDAAQTALADGTIDAVATDHAPHDASEKEKSFVESANGIVGLETAFAVLYTKFVDTGKIPLSRLLYLLNDGPRAVLGEPPCQIGLGQWADLVVADIKQERPVQPETFKSKGKTTPFVGYVLRGWPVCTFCNGQIVYNLN